MTLFQNEKTLGIVFCLFSLCVLRLYIRLCNNVYLSFSQAQMSSSSCPVNSPIMPPGSQGSHIHCPTLPQQAHQNSPSPVPSRTPTPHHTPPSIGTQQPAATAIPAPVPTPPAMPPGAQPQSLRPPSRQTPTPPTHLPPQVQPSLPVPPADQSQPQPRSQQSTAASVPTPTAPLLPPQPSTPVRRLETPVMFFVFLSCGFL